MVSFDPDRRLSEADVDRLDAFVTSARASEEWMQVDEIHGLITALVCGPDLVPPSEWLPAIWNGHNPEWESAAEFQEIMGLLMRMWNDVAERVNAGEGFAPIVLTGIDDSGDEVTVGAGWCGGFVTGMQMRSDLWSAPDDIDLDRLLAPIYAVAGVMESDEINTLLEQPGFEDALMDQVTESVYKIRAYWIEHTPKLGKAPQAPTTPPPGRNDPCPCGSGKKYKLCCGLVH